MTPTIAPTRLVRRLLRGSLGLATLVAAIAYGMSLPRMGASPRSASRAARLGPSFKVNAGGHRARSVQQWTIRFDDQEQIGLLVGAAVCDDDVFVVDSLNQAVHRLSLSQGSRVGQIWKQDDGTNWFRFVYGVAADCDAGRLYVVDYTGTFVFDLYAGKLQRHHRQPRNFTNNIAPPVLDRGGEALYVPGVWRRFPNSFLNSGLDERFDGDRLGYQLSLDNSKTAPLFPPLEQECWSFSSDCLAVSFDRVREPGPAVWLASHKVSINVGVFDESARLLRTVDVRSPMFFEDGQ